MNEHHNGLAVKDKDYIKSYLPQINLDSIKTVEIIINESSISSEYQTFKNTYLRGKKINDSYLYEVCSPLGLTQVKLAIDAAVKEGLFNPEIKVQNVSNNIYDYSFSALKSDLNIIQKYLNCSDKVIFARSESVKDWFIKEYLKEEGIDNNTLSELFIEKEKIRLNPAKERKDVFREYLSDQICDNLFSEIPRETISVGRISGFNITYQGNTFAIIDRPWGRDMAYIFAKEISKSYPTKIGIVGGCGSVNENYRIEDVANPTHVCSPEFDIVSLDNPLEISKKILVYNIDSPFLETNGFLKNLTQKNIDLIEMELVGFRKGTPANIPMYSTLYVMDEPLKGKTLNETYYNNDFLMNLFNKKDRAKDEATARVILGMLK
jgi:hypothetical protein